MKDIFKHLIVYILLIVASLAVYPLIKNALNKPKVNMVIVRGVDTSAFKEGSIVVMDKYGEIRTTFNCDSSMQKLGVVTKCDHNGEITLKYTQDD